MVRGMSWGRPTAQRQTPRGGGRPLTQTLTAAAKEKQPEVHDAPQLNRVAHRAGFRISMRDPRDEEDKECRIPLPQRAPGGNREGFHPSWSRVVTERLLGAMVPA
ncbi:hypothetical protein GCM10010267_27590 [Streptomyces griseorubens]|nr:hypothetical protein GCM10010267_27590 [Streptomyces griseorubens]